MPRRRSSDREPRPHSQRQLRVGEELRHIIAELIERGGMRDPDLRGASITITAVDVSPDLHNAMAFIMPLGGQDSERVLAAMRRAAPWFRTRVGEKAGLRHVPEIRFEIDKSFDAVDRIDSLLRRPDVARDLKGE
jgi:ribosome-binding factor A